VRGAVLPGLALALAAAASSAHGASVGDPLPPPPFERHAVAPAFRGVPARVDLRSDPKAPRYRTRLRQVAAEGPNFADRFTVVSWGCGTQCQEHAIVDAASGRVRVLPFTTSLGVAYRRDSRLFVADPSDACIDPIWVGPRVSRRFVWDGRALVPAGASPIVAPC
jgi:hypothetical protein